MYCGDERKDEIDTKINITRNEIDQEEYQKINMSFPKKELRIAASKPFPDTKWYNLI